MTTDAELYAIAERLYPLPRTVNGTPGTLATLDALEDWMELTPFSGDTLLRRTAIPVGTKIFDWVVKPDAENRRAYHSSLEEVPASDAPLVFAECVIPGSNPREVLLSTYTCHPQLANDNVSGMVVTAALAKWLASAPRRYTYRALFAPETIGALAWLNAQTTHRNPSGSLLYVGLDALQNRIIAGYTINNCGDERAWSFIPSRKGNTLADRAARHVLTYDVDTDGEGWLSYTFADRGSDERQFCAPGVDLPIASVMRSKHGTYPEYHTTADDLSIISAKGLGDSFRCYRRIIETIEANRTYRVMTIGEPMLSKYGLYPTSGGLDERAKIARDLCAYADGETDLIAIAEATGRAVWELVPVVDALVSAGLLREV